MIRFKINHKWPSELLSSLQDNPMWQSLINTVSKSKIKASNQIISKSRRALSSNGNFVRTQLKMITIPFTLKDPALTLLLLIRLTSNLQSLNYPTKDHISKTLVAQLSLCASQTLASFPTNASFTLGCEVVLKFLMMMSSQQPIEGKVFRTCWTNLTSAIYW